MAGLEQHFTPRDQKALSSPKPSRQPVREVIVLVLCHLGAAEKRGTLFGNPFKDSFLFGV